MAAFKHPGMLGEQIWELFTSPVSFQLPISLQAKEIIPEVG